MPFRPCPSGCGRFLSADDGHDRCLQCLGFQHAEDAFVDDSCACCGRMSMISLRSCLSFMKGLAPCLLRQFLSLKTVLLTALTSIKLVGDLQAFSVSEEYLVFGPVYSHVVLRPRPGYVPKVPTMPFRDQVVNLQALPSEEADPALALLCPVRALRIYMDRTRSIRSSEQLFVCHGGQQKGKAVSKQRLTHWIVEAVALAYQSQGEPCPLGVRAHSTRSVASSHALVHGASLADICRAAGWATPNTFARFYNLRVEPVSSRVLGK